MPAAILLVAGPSGAGKSTFIQSLRAGSLSREIQSLLPTSAARWRIIEGNDLLKRDLPAESVTPMVELEEGLVVHFDIAFGRRHGVTDYAYDPLIETLGAPEDLTIVNIYPSPVSLQTQFEGRQRRQREGRGFARELWRRLIHRPLRALSRLRRGDRRIDTSRIYRRPSELYEIYREWMTFSQSLVNKAARGKLICVEPASGSSRASDFVVIACPIQSS